MLVLFSYYYYYFSPQFKRLLGDWGKSPEYSKAKVDFYRAID